MSEDRRDSSAPAAPGLSEPAPAPSRRSEERFEVTWAVDCRSDETFLYAYITNVSAMGLFIRTDRPVAIGTHVHLSFAPEGHRPFDLHGIVAWINPHTDGGHDLNPGMGIRFVDLGADDRERLVEAIHTIAYVRGNDSN